jgi:hypothetical protein
MVVWSLLSPLSPKSLFFYTSHTQARRREGIKGEWGARPGFEPNLRQHLPNSPPHRLSATPMQAHQLSDYGK